MGNCLSVACSCAGKQSRHAKVPTPANTVDDTSIGSKPKSSAKITTQLTAQPSANEFLNSSLDPSPSATGPNVSPDDPRYTVFISHAGEDKATIAIPLRDKLKANGITAFVDEGDLQPGDDAEKSMVSAMETAKAAVVVLSPEFVARKWPMMELMCFLTRRNQGRHDNSQVPVIIPFFYRLNVGELYDEPRRNRRDKHGKLLYKESRFEERRKNGEPEANVANIKTALRKLRGITGIRNDVEASNDSSYVMSKRREILLKELCGKVTAAVLKEGTTVGVRPTIHESGAGQVLVNMFQRSFPPSSSRFRAVLDFGSSSHNPTTGEGWVKQHLLDQTSETPRVVTIHGMRGVGKSTILEALTVNMEIRERFCDGVHVLRLGKDATKATLFDQICQVLKASGAKNTEQSLRIREDINEAMNEFELWFDGKKCAILVDDAWVHGIGIGLLSRLCKMGSGKNGSSVVITTREYDVAILAPRRRIVRLEPRQSQGRESREILYLHADCHETFSDIDLNEDAINAILHVCGGLPVSLAVAGKGLKKVMIGMPGCEQLAWKRYLRQLEICRDPLLRKDVDSYGNLYATLATSIAFLNEKPREESLGFGTKMSFEEMHRRLCVMQKQSVVPCTMLKHLWGVESEGQAEMIATVFMEVGLANGEAIQIGSEYLWHLSLHDSLHDFAVVEAKRHSEEKKAHCSLLAGYMLCLREPNLSSKSDGGMKSSCTHEEVLSGHGSCVAEVCCVRTEATKWWSRELKSDRYIHRNLCRHLRGGGWEKELIELLFSPHWTKRQLEVNGIVVLETDFLVGIEVTGDQGFETKEALRLISEAARLSWTFVMSNFGELWFQLYGRLLSVATAFREIQDYLHRMEEEAETTWLRSVNCSLGPPGGTNTGIISLARPGTSIECMAIMGDRERVACGCSNGKVHIVNVMRNEIESSWQAHNETYYEAIHGIAIARDGEQVVTGSMDGSSKVWETANQSIVATFIKRLAAHVTCVAVMKDGKRVVSGYSDGSVLLWDVETVRTVSEAFRGHDGMVMCVAVLLDGEHFVTGGEDGSMRLWNVKSGAQVGDPFTCQGDEDGHNEKVSCLAVMPDGRRVVTGSRPSGMRIWDIWNHELVLSGSNYTTCVSVSVDGKRIASGSNGNKVYVWDAETGVEVCESLEGHSRPVTGVSFLGGSDLIVSCAADGSLRTWDLRRKDKKKEKHDFGVQGLCFSPSEDLVVSCSDDETLRVWDVRSGQQLGDPLRGHSGSVTGVAVTPDGERVVSVSRDRTVRIWELNSHELQCTLTGHTDEIRCIAITPNGKWAATGSNDRSVRLWDLSAMDGSHEILEGHDDDVRTVFVSDDGRRVVSKDDDGIVIVWELETRQCIERYTMERWILSKKDIMGFVGEAMAEDNPGLVLLPVSEEVWYGERHVRPWRQICKLATLESDIYSWVVSSDEKTLCVGLFDGTVGFLKLELKEDLPLRSYQ